MLTGIFSIKFFWGDRQELSASCADRAVIFLRDISTLSKSLVDFASVRNQGRLEEQTPVQVDRNVLKVLLESGVNRRDIDRSIIEDLGFSASLINRDASIAIRLHCGVYCGVVPNSCSIELLKLTEETNELLATPVLNKLFGISVRAWEPERGLLTSIKLREEVPQGKHALNVGWMTYLSTKYPIPQAVRNKFHITPINSMGHLISAMTDNAQLAKDQDTKPVQELLKAFASK